MSDFTPVPDVLALLVCDQIITDRLTGKQSLIGMFSTIHSARYPVLHPQLAVYVALTDGRGKTPLTIRIVDADDSRPPLVQGTGVVEFRDPRMIANLALQFHGLRFPEAGQYRVQLYCKEALLREARLMLVKAKRPPKPPGAPQPPPASDTPEG
jgi:hypothetical protein